MVVRWVFNDPYASASYTFEINPNEGGTPTLEKTFSSIRTASPVPKRLVFEGRPKPKQMAFSGVVREQDQYQALLTWRNKRRQVQVTDDLGRTYWIYITNLEFSPGGREPAPWRHEYTVEAIVLSEV